MNGSCDFKIDGYHTETEFDGPAAVAPFGTMAVGIVWAAVGALLGGIVGVVSCCGGPAEDWLTCGALAGAAVGSLLESDIWP